MLLTDADQLREALAIALRERDEARAEVVSMAQQLELEREASAQLRRECEERHDELRAEVERLRAALKAWLDADDASGIVRDAAERQREACAEAALRWSKSQAEVASDKERDSIMASAEMHREEAIMARRISAAIRATPLVTEGDSES